MAFPIVPKYNAVTTSQAAPLAGDLQLAELAINTQTNKLYLKGNAGIFEVGSDKLSTSQLTTAATAGGIPQLTDAGLISTSQIQSLTTSQIADLTQTAVAYKIPQLGSDGKIPSALLPASSVGALTYKGAWNVNTSPVIASGGVIGGTVAAKGDYYVASNTATVETAIDGKTQFLAGDILAFNGGKWDLIHAASSEVVSVNNQAPVNGNITLTAANVGAIATSDLTQLATAGKVPQLDPNGLIPAPQLPVASTEISGTIKVGSNLAMDGAGFLNAIPGSYTLPVADDSTLGGIKSSASILVDIGGTARVASAGTY